MQIRKLVPALVFLLMGLWLAAPSHAAEVGGPSTPEASSSCLAAATVDGTAADGIGIPAPKPMAFLCQPNGTFCQQAQCSCQEHGNICLCGGFLSGCNQTNHTFTCLCFQC
ncbi:MAG TPA: hypothetical protein VLX28_14705 [Thermoanaerobaculia bacterium]|nr:hypothetical protein [Thermoanaerobaculia bacterium]